MPKESSVNQSSKTLRFLYQTAPGRFLLRPLCSRPVSKLCGAFLDSPLSKPLIEPFLRRAGIDKSQYEPEHYTCFNDCFTRRIRKELRPIDPDPDALISPCDGLLSAYKIQNGTVIPVKQSRYTVKDLLQDPKLADRYRNGVCLVFRLCVNHYHRYCYIDQAKKTKNIFLPGKLHTVQPIALRGIPVFVQNCREYTVLHTEHFGIVTQVEVGALLVGRIKNLHDATSVRKGQEKGMFQYGGSTIILLLEPGAADFPEELFRTAEKTEIPVQMGQRLNCPKFEESKTQT